MKWHALRKVRTMMHDADIYIEAPRDECALDLDNTSCDNWL